MYRQNRASSLSRLVTVALLVLTIGIAFQSAWASPAADAGPCHLESGQTDPH